MILKKAIIISAAFILLFSPVLALAAATPPAIPLAVYGDVKIDSANAPIGTVVTVFNGASEVARVTTTQVGKYFLEVPAINAGATLTYKVNGILATQKMAANPVSVASDKIDLAITTPVVNTPAPASSGSSSGSSSGGATYNPPTPPTTLNTTQTTPTVPATPLTITPQVLGVKIEDSRVAQLNNILSEAGYIWVGDAKTAAASMGVNRDPGEETAATNKYTNQLIENVKGLEAQNIYAITNFVVYGTAGTKILGAGERAGVLNSYKAAFGKLPKTEAEWQDAIKIANGRWPTERNTASETKAKVSFKKIYGRDANMANANDNAAVTVMTYGLRPSQRNLNSEKAAIISFKYFMKRNPASAVDWDMVRAIAYSGAKR